MAKTTRELPRGTRRQQGHEAQQGHTYVVKSGDSLSKIAKDLLGDAGRWPEIFEANKDQIKDRDLIHPGQELTIPGRAGMGAAGSGPRARGPSSTEPA